MKIINNHDVIEAYHNGIKLTFLETVKRLVGAESVGWGQQGYLDFYVKDEYFRTNYTSIPKTQEGWLQFIKDIKAVRNGTDMPTNAILLYSDTEERE